MAFSKEDKARRRAQAAGPYPKPRGRAPRGSEWDRESGKWKESTCTAQESTAAVGVANVPHTTGTATSWQPPVVWQHACVEDSVAPLLPNSSLHVHEQLASDGSRAHSCIYGSPGGTKHVEQHTSPAGAVRAGLAREHSRVTVWCPFGTRRPDFYEHRCAFRISSVRARGRWATLGLVNPYGKQCTHCLRWQHTVFSPTPPLARPPHLLTPHSSPSPSPSPSPPPSPSPSPSPSSSPASAAAAA